ncbi:ATP-binding protein [Nonomuraea sediminis]|uniref:ATP-binding protein n=1 Tax=Nonomuraea sediminis TaxID=2835864 RepID=UPI001BDCFFDE|nr:BTAD domain-containing putative transcriptional regulator [Nonomuraea sediminis]
MRYGILGSTRAWRTDGDEVPLGGRARRALLALLLVRPGQSVSPDRLIDVLYGERPQKNPHHALQSQVSRLRADGIEVELGPAGYRLAVDPEDVDAHRFLRLADQGRRALDTDPERAAALLDEALGLWRGPALAEVDETHAVHLEDRRVAAQEDRAEADLRRGAYRAAIAALGELIERHPLRERLRGQLMRALSGDGRPAEALVVYEQTRTLLADELGADPSPELMALHQTLLRGETVSRGHVPAPPLTSFVGRADDVDGVEELLERARLVTLLGPGGVGKTRLATEVARRRPSAWMAELAGAREGDDLAQAVLMALGVRAGTGIGGQDDTAPLDRLVAALSEGPALLVLDNCEQVVEGVARLAQRLLDACRDLRVLTTSREPLAVTAEHLWPVKPLPSAQAVRLFTDRASAVRPGFAADGAVERICAALDGLPLAIELAAARTRTHDTAELAARLADEDRFRLLSRGSRTADARHQTLRAVVRWSWDLLTDAERTMAARLTVFSGGATAGAAAEVCGLPDAEDLLDSLADKSLVEVASGRYRMLETIRAFCAEQEDLHEVRQAHAAHFLALAEQADTHLRRAEQLEWLARLSADHDNLQAALRWAVESGRLSLGMRLVATQITYLWIRGMRGVVTAPAVALLELAGPDPDPALGDGYILCALVAASDRAGREAWLACRPAAERLALADPPGSRYPLVTFLWPMITAVSSGASTVALALLDRGAADEDPWERAAVQLVWGYPRLSEGDLEAAGQSFEAALEVFRELGDRWGSGLALDSLAWLAATKGDLADALARTEEAIALAEQLGAEEDLADLLCNRGDYGTDPARRRADYERAAELARRTGTRTYLATALRGLGDVAREEGDLAGARALYEQALERSDPLWIKNAGNQARLLVGLGNVAEAEGDRATARSRYVEALEAATTSGGVSEGARAVEALAGLALPDSPQEAAVLLGAATVIRGVAVVSPVEAGVRQALGDDGFEAARRTGERMSHAQALSTAGVREEVIAGSPIGLVP